MIADRLVDCVNAFAGFPTEAIGPFMERIRSIMRFADRLDSQKGMRIYREMAEHDLRCAFDLLHQHGMEWEQYS